MTRLSFKHDDAYKMLLRFRHVPEAIGGFILLSNSTVTITNIGFSQVLIGQLKGDHLVSSIYNFSHSPYDELFDGLFVVGSSASPVIIHHKITSSDDKILQAFDDSRLGLYVASRQVARDALNLTLTASITYPS